MTDNPFPLVLDQFGSTRVFYLEQTQSVVQVTLELDTNIPPKANAQEVFEINKYYIQELILHALLAEEASPTTHQPFHLPDGLIILSHDPHPYATQPSTPPSTPTHLHLHAHPHHTTEGEDEPEPEWSLRLVRASWKLGQTYNFYHLPSSVSPAADDAARVSGDDDGDGEAGTMRAPTTTTRVKLHAWEDKFTFFFAAL